MAAKALEARTALANYIGNTPWVDANKDNPEALERADKLVKGGLRTAAAHAHEHGRGGGQRRHQTSDSARQTELLLRAAAEYKLAALGWAGYLHQDENASDAYESRYWLADARHKQVKVEVTLVKLKKGQPPSSQEIAEAKQALVDVRDSNEDDKFLEEVARRVVDLSDVDRDIAFAQFAESNGAAGIEERQSPRREGTTNPPTGKADRRSDPSPDPRGDPGSRGLHGPRPGRARPDAQRHHLSDVRRRRILPLRALRRGARDLRAASTRTTAARTRTASSRGTTSSR